ncbi:COX8 domain-containing protein [Polyodon spathula]|uniref:COX8 domain-containing protein n=1 Tax=Polyodon spathula TaxID=7913 RepID=UPI001B7DCA5F|nr:COX8 domain-containing protein [Polyodon spathula]
MSPLWKGVASSAGLLRGNKMLVLQRAYIYSKPPKDKIGPAQTLFTISVFAVTLLTPAGWILHHLPEYRKR